MDEISAAVERLDFDALKQLLADATKLAPLPWSADRPTCWIWSGETSVGGPAHIADIRGWGYLTGHGQALRMNDDAALLAQRTWAALIVNAVNALPALIALAKPAGGDWRDIESAPPLTSKDENAWFHAIVYCPKIGMDGAVGEATRKSEGDWWWANTDAEYDDTIAPTHFMTLPAPPTGKGA